MSDTLFISDLHLGDTPTPEFNALHQLLNTYPRPLDAVYILGDLFEVWIGDDIRSPLAEKLATQLKTLSAKTHIYFMPGNRDFLVGYEFAARCGATLLSDPTRIDLYGIPTLLLHGDLLCTADQAYQRWRRVSRWPWLQRVFLLTPRHWRQKIAQRLRLRSQQYLQSLSLAQMDVTPIALEKMMTKFGVSQVIHGHTHQPAIHYFRTSSADNWRCQWVLGDWQWRPQALCFSSDRASLQGFLFL